MYQHKMKIKIFFYTLEFMDSRFSVCSENYYEAEPGCFICINIINATWLDMNFEMFNVEIVR